MECCAVHNLISCLKVTVHYILKFICICYDNLSEVLHLCKILHLRNTHDYAKSYNSAKAHILCNKNMETQSCVKS